MPPVALTPDEKADALKRCGADLAFLFGKYDVGEDTQAVFAHVGVISVQKFATIAKDSDDLTQMLKDHVGLDAAASLEQRVQVGAVVCAWQNASVRTQKNAEMEAELDTKEFVKTVPNSEWQAMRSALDRVAGKQDDKTTPAKEYVEKRLQEVEKLD